MCKTGTKGHKSGRVYVYDLTTATPTMPIATLENPTPSDSDEFGYSVAVSSDHLVVGATGDDTGSGDSGTAYVYDLSSLGSPLATLNQPFPADGDEFGQSVAIADDYVVVGVPSSDPTGVPSAGIAYLYDLSSPGSPLATFDNPTIDNNDLFGSSVALANGTAVVGAYHDDTQDTDQGAVHLFELASAGSLSPTFDGSGNLTLTDTAGADDDLTVMLTGGGADLQITSASEQFDSAPAGGTLSNGNQTLTLPLTSVNSLVIDALAGDDDLTLDYSGGNFTLPISYHGGSQATTSGDALTLTGGTHTTTTYTFTGANSAGMNTGFDGNLDFDGQLITFTGLEPITNSGTAEDVEFNLPDLPNPDATLRNNATSGMNELVGSSFENTSFANPVGATPSLTINGGTDTDTISVEGLDSSFDADLSVLAGDAADSVSFQTNPTDLGSGTLITTASNISVGQSLTTSGDLEFEGNLDFVGNNTLAATNINFRSGTTVFDGTNTTIDVTGTATSEATNVLDFQDGDLILANSSSFVSEGNATLTNGGANFEIRGSGTFTNNGLFSHSASGSGDNLEIFDSITFQNNGTFDFKQRGDIRLLGTSTFNNAGLIVKTVAGSDTSFVFGFGGDGGSFHNLAGGVVRSQAGTLNIAHGNMGTSTSAPASIWTAVGGNVQLSGFGDWTGTFNGSATAPNFVTIEDNGNGSVSNDFRVGTAGVNFNITGNGVEWNTDDIFTNGNVLTNLGVMTITGSASKELQGAGELVTGNGGVITIESAATVTSTGGSLMRVASGGLLQGNGAFTGEVIADSNGTVAPGVSPGVLGTGDLTLNAGSNFDVEINGTAGPGVASGHDQLDVTGDVDLSGSPDLNLTLGFTPAPGDLFTIIENNDTDLVTGTFAGLDEGEVFTRAGEMFQITYQGGTGNDVVLRAFDNTFDGTPDADDFLVTDDGTLVHLSLDGSEIFSGPRNTSLVINGLAGDDSLTIDNTSSTQVIADITFNGEDDDDSLSVLGGTATDLIYTPHAGSGDTARGTIELDGQTITFTGLEPTLVTTTATNVTIDLTSLAAAETVTLSDDGGAANGMSRVSFLSNTLEDLDFANPTALLRVIADTNATVDTVNVEGLDSSLDADLTLEGASIDSINFQTVATNLDTGDLNATGGSIAVDTDVTTTGNATLNATATTISGAGTLNAGDLTADAISGIQLNTAVATIDASVSAAGSIDIVETDMVTLADLDTVDGSIDVTAGGSLTATDVVAGGAGDISLSTDPGSGADVLVNSVTADANTVTITADGAIEEDSLDPGVDLTATNLNLAAETGIGNLDSIEIDADDGLFQGLTANSTSGDIQLTDPDELRILSASTFGNNTTLGTGGDATIDGFVDATANVSVTSQAAMLLESFSLVSTLTGNISLDTLGGSLIENDSSSILSGDAIDLSSSDSISLSGTNTANSTFTSTATNDTTVTTDGSISSAGTASLSTTSGMIEVLGFGMVSSSGADVILDAGSSVLIEGTVNASGPGSFSVDIDAGTTVEVTMFGSVDASADITIDSGGDQLIGGAVGFFTSDIQLNSGAALSITGTASVAAATSITTISATDTTVSGGTVMASSGNLVDLTAGGNFTLDAGGFIDSGVDLMITADGDLTLASGTSASGLGLVSLSGGQAGAGATLAIGSTVSGNTISINGGAGADTIIIDDNDGSLGDGGTVENLQNNATINAGGGSDSLQLDDSGSADADTIDVNQSQNEQIIGLNESYTISYADLESAEIFAGVAEDIFNVQLSPVTAFTVHGNDPTIADPSPGDTLNILTSDNTLTLPFVFAATTDGSLTDSPDQTLTWTSIESFTIDGEAFVVNDLFVLTGNNADRIIFFSTNGIDTEVRIGNTTYGPFAIPATSRMVAFSQGGNDQIIVHGLLPPIAEFHGGDGNDYITGSNGSDFLFGGLGNDIVLGGEGDNFIHGDDPLDPTVGGIDRLEGRAGDDTIIGGAGNDRILGNEGEDTLDGGQGLDQLFGGLGDDFSFGGGAGDGSPDTGMDLIRDEIGDDVILGGAGQDMLFGDRDNDLVIGGTGGDRINGGSSNDLLVNGSSDLESAIDLAMTQIAANAGSRPVLPNTLFNTNVLPALTMWRMSSSATGFGPFTDDTGIEITDVDDMTGGSGTDIFDAALNDLLRDVRPSESDTVI